MDQSTLIDIPSDRLFLTRRLFTGGLLATLATAGIALPAVAEGLKDVDNDDDAQNDRDDDDASGDIPESWQEIGITTESTYESPQFGYSVEWEQPWTVNPMDPGMTDPEMELDDIRLKWETAARESIVVSIVGLNASSMGIGGFGDYMVSPDGMGLWASGSIEVEEKYYDVDDTSFELLFSQVDADDQTLVNWVYMVVAEVSSDAWAMATLVTSDEFLEDTYEGLSNQVLVNGESLIRLSTWRDIERAIG
jgi:hypothetical protein